MTTRAQDNAIERLALDCGRVAVRDGFADGHVDVTVPGGAVYRIAEHSDVTVPAGVNHSVDWGSGEER